MSNTAKRVFLEEDGNGVTEAFLGERPPVDASRKRTPKQVRDEVAEMLEAGEKVTPQHVMCLEMGLPLKKISAVPELAGASSTANDNVKNKIQDKTGEGSSRMQEHVREVEAMVRDRERESGEVSDMEDDGDDAGGVEIGMWGNKIQDKDLVFVGRRPPLRFKATYAPRPAVVQNKIQDKTPERTKEKRARVEGRRRRRVESEGLTAVVNELGAESPDEDDEDDELREVEAVMRKGEAEMQEFVREYESRFPGAPAPVILPAPGSLVRPIAGMEGGEAFAARLKASGVGSRSGVYRRMWRAKREELHAAMLAYGKAMAEYVRLQGEVVALEESWKWWKGTEDRGAEKEGESSRGRE